ncbi:MAG: chemotaxis protein MotB [Desulfonauticus sp.]|nr:chemotaxis protein MotB [Desulfonauticus sp.]
MARRKKRGGGEVQANWLVTFSDLVTLLLTFFVLLLSMSSMDKSIVRQVVSVFTEDVGFLDVRSTGKIEDRFKVLEKILQKPWEILEKKKRILDLLFPDMVLPKEINRSTLEKNLEILQRPEGVALVLHDGILFAPGSAILKPEAKRILEQIVELAMIWPAPVNIAGYTDSSGGIRVDNYELAAERALSVLAFFREKKIREDRLSVSAYGPNFPLADNKTREGRARNRRVEILFKLNNYTYL